MFGVLKPDQLRQIVMLAEDTDMRSLHVGLSREQSDALNARLMLISPTGWGGSERLAACIAAAAEKDTPKALQQP